MIIIMNTIERYGYAGGATAAVVLPAPFLTRKRPYSIIGNVTASHRLPVRKSIEITSGAEATDLPY
jgi:hypothetical protein